LSGVSGLSKQAPNGIIDTHAFAISPVFLAEHFLPTHLDATLDSLVEDMDHVGVSRAIVTPFITTTDDKVGSVPFALGDKGERIGVQLYLQPNRAPWTAHNVRQAHADKSVLGLRAVPSLFAMDPGDARLAEVWQACQDTSLPVQVVFDASKHSSAQAFQAFCRQWPELVIVLSVARTRHKAALKALVEHPRVFVQVPALLDGEVAAGEPTFLRWALKNLPADRIMFGSDRLGREESYLAKVKALKALPPKQREWVASRTAATVYCARRPAWRHPD
jgi:predicted TIM-barrel fold metal-dependent hydrolase